MTMTHQAEAARLWAAQAAQQTGEYLRVGFGTARLNTTKSASAADVVTAYDKEAESRLFSALSTFDTGVGFHGEEQGASGSTDTFWLVDPIDGTGHFLRGIPMCTTMIALVHQGEVIASVIHDFVTGDLYSAAKGHGATRNNDVIATSDRTLRESYICIDIDFRVPENLPIAAQLLTTVVPISTMGYGYEFAMIASGRLDGRVQKNPGGSIWDYAAGALLVAEAGGKVTNLGATTYDYRNLDLLATNPRVHAELTKGPTALFPVR